MKKRSLKGIFFIFITVIFLSILSTAAYSNFYVYAYNGFYQKDITIYWAKTNEPMVLEWDPVPNVNYYECKLDWIQGDKVLQTYSLGTTTNTQITITAPRAGVFVVRVRACEVSCSDWVLSIDTKYATVDGEHKAWIIIFSLPGVGPIIIK